MCVQQCSSTTYFVLIRNKYKSKIISILFAEIHVHSERFQWPFVRATCVMLTMQQRSNQMIESYAIAEYPQLKLCEQHKKSIQLFFHCEELAYAGDTSIVQSTLSIVSAPSFAFIISIYIPFGFLH